MNIRLVIAIVWHTSCTSAVKLAGDWVGDIRKLLLLLLEIFARGRNRVLFQPVGSFLDGLEDLLLHVSLVHRKR